MNLRWLWFDHFPPELDLSRDQRKKAQRMAAAHAKREPGFCDAHTMFLRTILPIVILAAAWLIIGFRSQTPFAVSVFWLIWHSGFAWATHRSRTPFIRKALNDLGYPVCMECGHILIGVEHDCCPECGARRFVAPLRRLNDIELHTPEIISAMKQLGYGVCWNCGAMWFELEHDPLPCPDCGKTAPK